MNISNYTVILPTYNEGNNQDFWRFLVELISTDLQIIIVDDGNDEIESHLKIIQYQFPESKIKYYRGLKGEAESIEHGIRLAKTDEIIIADADGSHPVSAILRMIELYEKRSMYCIVVGTRAKAETKFINKFFSKLGNQFIWFITGIPCEDITGRFILANKSFLLEDDIWYGYGDVAIAILNKAKREKIFIDQVYYTFKQSTGKDGRTTSFTKLLKFALLYSIRVFNIKTEKFQLFSNRLIQRGLSRDITGEKNTKISYFAMFLNSILSLPLWVLSYIVHLITFIPFTSAFFLSYPQSITGYFLRVLYWKHKLGICGRDVLIDRGVSIWNPKNLGLLDGCRIDANVTIIAHNQFVCEENVTIHQNSILNSKGTIGIHILRDSCIGANCAIFASSNIPGLDQYGEPVSFSYASRLQFQKIQPGEIYIGKRSFIGTNSVLINSTLADYTIIGANSLIKNKNLTTGIYAGTPLKLLKSN